MRELKAAVIGAGSTYTPELIEGFISRQGSLNFSTFCLMDINAEKLGIVGSLAKRMFAAKGSPARVILTDDLDKAISGADYIFSQIRVGGLAARVRDEKIPLEYGLLGQETTGAGGFMNALRTLPAMFNIARRIEKLCPDAWLINFSNPSGIVAEALLNHTKVKMLGLCNCFINMGAALAQKLNTADFYYEYLGLNHLSWITSVKVNGRELIDTLVSDRVSGLTETFDNELLAAIPAIPSYYLAYFYEREKQIQKCLQAEKTRGESCVEIEDALLKQYSDPGLCIKPKELAERGGAMYSSAAVSLVDAIENDKNEYHAVNVKNQGAVPFMGDDDVLELKCLVNRAGAQPVKIAAMDNLYIKGMMQAVKAYEKLTVRAVVNKSRADALAALMVHPLIGDYPKARSVLDAMFKANAEYLPGGFLEGYA